MAGEPSDETYEAVSQPPPGAPASPVPELPEPPQLPPVPEDADDTRGHHFRRLLGHPLTLILGGLLVLAVLVIAGTQIGWGVGAAAAGVALLVVLLTVFMLASGKAHEDFFRAYADGRGLSRMNLKTSLPPVTPLLRKGDRRYAEQRFNGILPGGLDGSICLYTYEDEYRDSDGQTQTTYVHYTLVMTQLPAMAPFMQELYCQRRVGFRFMDSMEDVFRTRRRVEHESAAVDKKFEVFIGRNDDLNRARQILSPTFLVWLETHSPDAYAFELVAGSLVCNVKGHKKSASELDVLCQASAAVARRMQEEATELTGAIPGAPPH